MITPDPALSNAQVQRSQHSPPKASELLAAGLRGDIIRRALPAGSRLPPEAELIARSGLSRATVREALRLLDADGLIEVKRGPGGGITVRHPDPSTLSHSLVTMVALADVPLRELFEFRLVVEPAAAAAAAGALDESAAAELVRTVEEGEGTAAALVDFHLLVARASGNAFYDLILAALHGVLEWHVELESLAAEKWEDTRSAHGKIARAIASGDPRKAERAMRRHIEEFMATMEKAGRLDEPILPRSRWRPSGLMSKGAPRE